MPKKILITGIAGFMGTYLTEFCLKQNVDVFGWLRPGTSGKIFVSTYQSVKIDQFDMSDREIVKQKLALIRPDWIYHLAAKSHIGRSWEDPQDTLVTNVSCQIHLLEAMRSLGLESKVLIAGSSEEYGIVKQGEVPVNEDAALNPVSPYAVSKVAQDLMGLQYHRNYGLPILRVRSFNQSGPRRSEQFVTSAFARQVALIEAGLQPAVVKTGNLDAIRDFIDVRDGVRALWLCLERCTPGNVYNICSGRGYAMRYILEVLKKLSSVEFEVQYDPAKARPSDLPVLIGDATKFKSETGWSTQITFEQSLEDLLNDWRARVKR